MIFAGFWIRLVAHLVDFVGVNAVELGLEYGISIPLGLSTFNQQILGVILSLGLSYYYYVELPQKRGTTLGKELFGIYVLNMKTSKIFTRKQAIVRLVGYLISYAMVGCGFLMAAFHPQKRGFHDLLAGTVCVRRKKGDRP